LAGVGMLSRPFTTLAMDRALPGRESMAPCSDRTGVVGISTIKEYPCSRCRLVQLDAMARPVSRLLALPAAPGHASFARSAGDRLRHGTHDPLVENARNDVVLGEMILWDDAGNSVGGGQLHCFVDLARPHIERPAEDAGKGEQVVHLVGIIGPAGCQYP